MRLGAKKPKKNLRAEPKKTHIDEILSTLINLIRTPEIPLFLVADLLQAISAIDNVVSI